MERSPWYQIIGNATFSVDTFFFISGFLVTLIFLRQNRNYPDGTVSYLRKGITDTFLLLLYRYIRLTPVYLFVIFFNDFALRFVLQLSNSILNSLEFFSENKIMFFSPVDILFKMLSFNPQSMQVPVNCIGGVMFSTSIISIP